MCITFLGGPQEGRWIPPVPIIPFHFYTCFLQGEMACYVALLLHGLAAMDALAVSSTVGGARGAIEVSEHKMPPPNNKRARYSGRPPDRATAAVVCADANGTVSCSSALLGLRGAKRMPKNHVAPYPFLTTWTSGGHMNRTMQGILWIVDDPLSAGVIVVAFVVQVGICILPRSGCTLEVGGAWFGVLGE